ncbi:MAG: HDOD domain-containing protein [Candidatus Tectomicrobia bacterium]|uniref:HDOD domain-containing protein n=1 Tax=Tectimicrobiota bacterium TaxID=2528274 RepID=A0A932I371_UNCTE|nr:HDOD domain-containing protein [Candidatus Tectomicrobia bacterium]
MAILNLRQLLGPDDSVPSLPTVFHQLDVAVNNPRSSMRQVAEIISADQALSARLLKLVNSAFFGFPSRIETITHAVTIVGMQQLRDLALATSIVQMFKGIPIALLNPKSFWMHSIASGTAARILASYHQEPNVERFFVAGLLHDIGHLVLYRHQADLAKETLLRSIEAGRVLYQVEREMMGTDHAEVGGELLSFWKLPPSLAEAVRFHHLPCGSGRYPLEASIVHLSDVIANALQLGTSGERHVPPLEPRAWDGLKLPVSILSPAVSQLEQQVAGALALFLEDAR